MIRALGASLGVPVVTVIASLREPADFAGLPVVRDDGSIRLAEPSWARELAAAGAGLLFLDELTTAAPAVQAALLRVVLERVVGDVVLPREVAVVAAANPPEVSAGGWDLSPPLANRFCHIDWPVDPARFLEALASGWDVPDVGGERADYDASTSDGDEPEANIGIRVRAAVGGFLKSRPTLLFDVPNEMATSGRAWPSPRTWDMAASLWAEAERLSASDDVVMTLISGCIGPGAARELLAWRREADLPDPEAVLRDPSSFRLPERGDRQFAVLNAVAAAVSANPTRERWEAAFQLVEQAVQLGSSDIAAVAARALAKCVPPDLPALPATMATLAPVLDRAGLLTRRRPGRP
jgi:hypothetical protein